MKRVTSLAGRERAGSRPAAHEEHRRRGGLGDLGTRRSEALVSPAIGQADDQQARALRRGEDAFAAALGDQRLGPDAHGLLDQQAGVAQQPADRLALLGLPRGAEQLQRRLGLRGEPGTQLQCRPVVLRAPERDEDRRVRAQLDRVALPGDEHRHVAGRLLQHVLDVTERDALAPERAAALDEHEIDLLGLARAGRGPVPAARRRRPRRAWGPPPPPVAFGLRAISFDASLQQRVLGLEPASDGRRTGRLHQPRQDQLARRLGACERLGQRQQLWERRVGLRRDEDRAAPAPPPPGTPRRPGAWTPRAPPRPACRTRCADPEVAASARP